MNRNEIKWQSFDALTSSQVVLKNLEQQRKKISKPTLSDDEKEVLESLIMEAWHTKEIICCHYFWNGNIFTKTGIIKEISQQKRKIFFQDQTSLYFEQLISIEIL